MNHNDHCGNSRAAILMRLFRRPLVFCLVLALVLAGFCAGATAAEMKKILIVHSFHQGLAWTDSVSQGIQATNDPFNKQIELYFTYLDVKRRPEPVSETTLVDTLLPELEQTAFDVIIVSGDAAFELIRNIEEKNNRKTPLVFCSVSRFDPKWRDGDRPMTGVLKTVAHQANLDLMQRLHPQCQRIVFIFDWTAEIGSQSVLSNLVAAIPGHILVDVWPNPDFERLPAKLQGLGNNDLVYLLTVNRDKQCGYLHDLEGIDLVSRWSPAPIYSPLEVYLGRGVVGGKITSGFRQGELAAQLALRIISGEAAESIPVITQSPNPYIFDHRQLKRHGIKLSRLPEESIIRYQPPGFWVRWGKIIAIISMAVLLAAMVPLVSILILSKNRHAWTATKAKLENHLQEKTIHLRLLNQKLKKQSRSDALTGLANRRYILQRFAEEIKKARRYGAALSIALLDLDQFKQINTEFGYIIGDQIIRDVARAIRNCIREIDLVGRFSGEAFLIILPSTDLKMTQYPIQRIFDTINTLQWENGRVRVTLSGGLAEYRGQTLAQMTKEAEDCQHEAKDQGGNRFLP